MIQGKFFRFELADLMPDLNLKPEHICNMCNKPLASRRYMRPVTVENSDRTSSTVLKEHVMYVCPRCDGLGARP